MTMVLDCSATLAWLYGDERSVEIEVLFEQVVEHGATVPALWHLEVANALTVAVRRGRITAAFRNAALDDLAKLDVVTDAETERHAWGAAVRLADLHALTVYDAAYWNWLSVGGFRSRRWTRPSSVPPRQPA